MNRLKIVNVFFFPSTSCCCSVVVVFHIVYNILLLWLVGMFSRLNFCCCFLRGISIWPSIGQTMFANYIQQIDRIRYAENEGNNSCSTIILSKQKICARPCYIFILRYVHTYLVPCIYVFDMWVLWHTFFFKYKNHKWLWNAAATTTITTKWLTDKLPGHEMLSG